MQKKHPSADPLITQHYFLILEKNPEPNIRASDKLSHSVLLYPWLTVAR